MQLTTSERIWLIRLIEAHIDDHFAPEPVDAVKPEALKRRLIPTPESVALEALNAIAHHTNQSPGPHETAQAALTIIERIKSEDV